MYEYDERLQWSVYDCSPGNPSKGVVLVAKMTIFMDALEYGADLQQYYNQYEEPHTITIIEN